MSSTVRFVRALRSRRLVTSDHGFEVQGAVSPLGPSVHVTRSSAGKVLLFRGKPSTLRSCDKGLQ